jgi:DNA-binding response OmpR family regulator
MDSQRTTSAIARNVARKHSNRAAAGVLLVGPFDEDLTSLLRILDCSDWNIYWYKTCAEAVSSLARNEISVVLCECDLPDGNWKDLLACLACFANPAPLIVTSRLADDFLWAEVLNLGGYDLLVKPFNAEEVMRTLYRATAPGHNTTAAA